MKVVLSVKHLKVFVAIPRDSYATLARVAPNDSPPERQRIIRRLESFGLIEALRHHEKSVRIRSQPFPVGLHAILGSKPHVAPFLAGARLPILAVLADATAPISVSELVRISQTHPNTVYRALRAFKRRAMLEKKGSAYRLADHVTDLRQLAKDYATHILQLRLDQYPRARPIVRSGLRLVVESDDPIPGLSPTAHYRFQLDGADVLSPSCQYAITVAGQPITLSDALLDAKAVGTPPRTMAAIMAHLKTRGKDATRTLR